MAPSSPHRRTVLHGLAGIAVAASTGAHAAVKRPAFVALGDWGREGGEHQSHVAAAMALAAAEIGSRCVLSVGDNFYPAGVQSVTDPHWKVSFEDVYAAASLQTPWYVALGNHDYRGHPGAQLAYSRINARWRMPGRYYLVPGAEIGAPDLDIFVIDTTPLLGGHHEDVARLIRGRVWVPDGDPQVAWLGTALEQSKARWKVVVGHHPIHSGGHHGGEAALAASIEPLMQAHGVQVYICGHDHVLQHVQVGGIDHICSGAGSSAGQVVDIPGTRFRHDEPGFAMFTVGADSLDLEFRDFNGKSLYQAAIPSVRG
ncbi:metallophosphoesterase [Phenylobacterium sp.]|uniref:metallophosphoesterase n=1 Tax=Phenylobacterium sp. TaxID=1871053 RepID=UPI0025F103AD|nr:metallophosphoesterase [Phenylobacterium sp.]